MNRKKLLLILLAVLCLCAGAVFGVVGVQKSLQAKTYEDLKYLGHLTFEAYAAAQEEDGTYTIYYHTVGDETGVLTYERYDVGREEYDSYQFDVAVANSDLDSELIPKSKITRYVYTYRKDGELISAIYDQYKTIEEVSELISDANRVSPLRFYVFAGILLICAVYIFVVALSRKPNQQTEKRTA